MRRIEYYISTSLDGYIAGPDHNVSSFAHEGGHVEEYLKALESYDTVIMGRRTYEAGYQYGLEPGQTPYPGKRHIIFSESLDIPDSENLEVHSIESLRELVSHLRLQDGSKIYLCGGGVLAGALLRYGMIDDLVLKINPIVLGKGIRLFENEVAFKNFVLKELKQHENGVLTARYCLA